MDDERVDLDLAQRLLGDAVRLLDRSGAVSMASDVMNVRLRIRDSIRTRFRQPPSPLGVGVSIFGEPDGKDSDSNG